MKVVGYFAERGEILFVELLNLNEYVRYASF
jgi:hypothetical protein